MSHDFDKLFEHQDSEGQEVQSGERLRHSRIISYQTPEACGPAETVLNDPATRQQDKTFFRFREFDHFPPNAMRVGLRGGTLARIARSTKASSTDSPVTACTARANAPTCARSCSLAGGTNNANKLPSGSTATCVLLPLRRFAPSYWARPSDSGVDCKVRESKMAAVGVALRPAATRKTSRKSWPIAAKTPALIQR